MPARVAARTQGDRKLWLCVRMFSTATVRVTHQSVLNISALAGVTTWFLMYIIGFVYLRDMTVNICFFFSLCLLRLCLYVLLVISSIVCANIIQVSKILWFREHWKKWLYCITINVLCQSFHIKCSGVIYMLTKWPTGHVTLKACRAAMTSVTAPADGGICLRLVQHTRQLGLTRLLTGEWVVF